MATMDPPTQSSIWVSQCEKMLVHLGIVDGTMGILSRKMAMPAQLPANPIHYKEVLNPKAIIDPKKYDFVRFKYLGSNLRQSYSILYSEERATRWQGSRMIDLQTWQTSWSKTEPLSQGVLQSWTIRKRALLTMRLREDWAMKIVW